MRNKALFLDRDGVINFNHGYVHKIENFDFIDGIFDLTRTASSKNYIICIVTNQAGIGRGYYSEEDFLFLTKWMCKRFKKEGVIISKVYYSPYHPIYGIGKFKKNDDSRKPNPGMIFQAIDDFDIDAKSSVLIGDNATDIKAAISAGIGTNIYFGEADISNDVSERYFNKITNLVEAQAFLKG